MDLVALSTIIKGSTRRIKIKNIVLNTLLFSLLINQISGIYLIDKCSQKMFYLTL
jgi:hypothetical protein